jgi:chemotaxis response regulator CheB
MPQLRVLIVDDSLIIRAMVEDILLNFDNSAVIAVAGDVPAAREILKTFRPTVITLDLNMPGVDGLTFLDEMNRQDHAPVIVLSSNTRAGCTATTEALAHGADACFDKNKIITDAKAFIRLIARASGGKIARSKKRSCPIQF